MKQQQLLYNASYLDLLTFPPTFEHAAETHTVGYIVKGVAMTVGPGAYVTAVLACISVVNHFVLIVLMFRKVTCRHASKAVSEIRYLVIADHGFIHKQSSRTSRYK